MASSSDSAATAAAVGGAGLSLSAEHEVFLSFVGKDTGNGFTDFLYVCLQDAGVRTFRYDNELELGKNVHPENLKAIITNSRISIPILSKNYISSEWCMLELTQMIEYNGDRPEKTIFPIIYDRSYDAVNLTWSCEKAFRQLGRKKNLDETTINRWREALTKVIRLKGLVLQKETGGREGELVRITVKQVLKFLKHLRLDRLGGRSEGRAVVVGDLLKNKMHKRWRMLRVVVIACVRMYLSCSRYHPKQVGRERDFSPTRHAIRKQLLADLLEDKMRKQWRKMRVIVIACVRMYLSSSKYHPKQEGRERNFSQIRPAILTNNVESSFSATASATPLIYEEYEVYLSYSGRDTRNGFANFLYTYLQDAGIRTFRGDSEVCVGNDIESELCKAINNSKISIPILSKSYALSTWCLLELTQMVECQAEGEKMILPIYYDVDPHDVRHQSGIYEGAFRQHGKKKRLPIRRWKEALTKVGQLEGLELKKETNWHEGELVKVIVRKVLLELKKKYTHVPKNLVGMDNHIEQLKGLLKLDSEGVRIVGIHGMGGLGKTTIARVIYNQLCQFFEGYCFLENVRENSKRRDGILNLQNQLISMIQNKAVPNFFDVHEGTSKIKDTVRGRKVIIVLDDVDENVQVDMLMGNYSWYGALSRIIITTRCTNVLGSIEMVCQTEDLHDIYMSYRPDLMNEHHAIQLFNMYASTRDSSMKGYNILSKDVAYIAKGLPLILEVLGSTCFVEEDKSLFKEKLWKLRDSVIPHNNVLEKLRFSFALLEYEERQMFLDIACLFSGMDKTRPCYMWDDFQFYPRNGIRVLVKRSLITDDDNKLRMHDLLRDLGRQVICEEGLDELGKRSRLWCKEEAMHVLETRQGTTNVEALHLDFVAEDLEFRPNRLLAEDFVNLHNLRFLILGSVDLHGDFENLFVNLRWLKWAPLGSFSPINCHLKNLVILDLSYSQITDDWKGWSVIKMVKRLKVLDLSHCYSLTTTSHFSMLATLEQLILSSCFGLVEIDPFFGNLTNLRVLDLSNCLVLKGMLDCSTFSNLESLDVHSCATLRGFERLGELKSLRNLNTSGCRFIERLSDLSNLKMLRKLDTSGCVNLIEIQGLDELYYLECLDMRGCKSMKRLPDVSKLRKLEEVNAAKCDKLLKIDSLRDLNYLVTLDVSFCMSLTHMPTLSKLDSLKKLRICGLKKLREISGLVELKSLELLDISGCKSIENLPEMSNLKKLKEIYACRCVKLIEIRGLEELRSLELLDISGCNSIEKLADLSNLKRLKVIKASGCSKLSEIPGIHELKWLALLDISGCMSLKNLPYLSSTRINIFY